MVDAVSGSVQMLGGAVARMSDLAEAQAPAKASAWDLFGEMAHV